MYTNIGAKIKMLAQIIAWLGIVGSVLGGLALIAQGVESPGDESLAGMGVAILIAGPLVSWISSLFFFGFGELLEKAAEIAKNTARGNSSDSLTAKMENDEKMKVLMQWRDNNLISEEDFEIKKQEFLKGE